MLNRLVRWVAVVAATVGGAFGTFALLLRLLRPGWVSREYGAIAFWSLPLAALVLVGATLIGRFRARPWLFRSLAVVTCIAITVGWTLLAIALTGGYALAFDANPFYCWLVGSATGMLVANTWPRQDSVPLNAA